MLAVDTSAWIEWLIDGPLTAEIARHMPPRSECIVPTLVQHELAKWLTRERGEAETDEFIAYTQMCVVAPLDTPVALVAADLCRQHKLATADAVIYATALSREARLLTCDKHFEGLAGVVLVRKGG
jgi:predicted nucleic acid-binding protein